VNAKGPFYFNKQRNLTTKWVCKRCLLTKNPFVGDWAQSTEGIKGSQYKWFYAVFF